MALGTLDPPPQGAQPPRWMLVFRIIPRPCVPVPVRVSPPRGRTWLGDPFSGVSGGLSRCLEPIQDEKHIVGLTCGFGWIWSSIHREVRTPTLAKQLIPRQVQVTCRTASTMLHMDRFSGYATICLGLDATL